MEDLILEQKIYDFLLYIYPVIARYPKFEKHTLQMQIKNAIIDMERRVIKARKSKSKKTHIYEADIILSELKMLMRLSLDLRYITPRRYGIISRKLAEIGKLIGGFIKSVQD